MPTTSIFSGSAFDEAGSDTNGSGNNFVGHILWCQVKAGTTVVSHFDARLTPVGTTSGIEDYGNFWSLGGGANIEVDVTSPIEKKIFDARASNVIDYDNDGADIPSTGLAVIGEGEGNNQFLEYIQNTQGQVPLWEEKFTVKDQSNRLIILDQANLELAYNANINPVYSLKLDPNQEPGIDDIKPGMQSRLVIDHGYTEVDDTFFVGTVEVHLTKEAQEEISTEVVLFRGNPVIEGTGSWFIDSATAQVIQPNGKEFISAGLNGGVHIGTNGFSGTDLLERSFGWAWERYPGPQTINGYQRLSDIWPGDTNIVAGNEIFPGGTVSAGIYYDHSTFTWKYITDRVYSLTGQRSTDAISAGITNTEDHWHSKLYRVNALLRYGPYTWNGATWMDSSRTIDQYVGEVDRLERLGITVSIEDHDFLSLDPTMPASVVANPVLPVTDSSLSGNTPIIDALKFYDALCTAFPDGKRNIWIELPNEAHTTGRILKYDDWIVTWIRRIRAKGYTGIICVPSARWAGELANIGRGEYDSLMVRLESYGVGWNLLWMWHNYGARYGNPSQDPFDGSNTFGTYAEVDLDLTKCRNGVDGSNRKYAIWMSEYGVGVPPDGAGPTGFSARERQGADIIASTTYGSTMLGLKHKHICPTWWTTGDNTFNSKYALCYGQLNKGNENGPEPHGLANGTTTFSGTYPWWDVTTPALRDEWLTPYGRKHWDLAHLIWQG